MLVITVLVLYILELCITDVINICSRATAFVIRGKHPELGPDRPPGSVHTYYNHHTAGILTPLKRQERTFLLKPSYNLKQSLTRTWMETSIYMYVRVNGIVSSRHMATAHLRMTLQTVLVHVYTSLSQSLCLSLADRRWLVRYYVLVLTPALASRSDGRSSLVRGSWLSGHACCCPCGRGRVIGFALRCIVHV